MSPWLEDLRLVLVCGLLLSGALLMTLSAYGLLKFPDVYSRGHAQTKATTMGICAMMAGLWMLLGNAQGGWPLFFGMLAQVVTIPISGHMIALLAFQKRVPRYRRHKVSYHRGYKGPPLEP
jgi:multicomponent Na+:H+ antiporter subunit G